MKGWMRIGLLLALTAGCGRSAEDWAAKGTSELKAWRLEEAEASFDKALELNPVLPEALYGQGWLQSSRRDTAAARVFFEQCIRVAPQYYGGYKGMGSVHLSLGFYEQAEASLRKALSLKPDDAASYGSLGYVYLATRRLDAAEKAFQKARQLEPDRAEISYLMAELRARQGLVDEALAELVAGQSKQFEEVKFRFLSLQLEGQLRLKKALVGVPVEGGVVAPDLPARLAQLDAAEKALAEALTLSFVEERVRVNQLRRSVRLARDRIKGAPYRGER